MLCVFACCAVWCCLFARCAVWCCFCFCTLCCLMLWFCTRCAVWCCVFDTLCCLMLCFFCTLCCLMLCFLHAVLFDAVFLHAVLFDAVCFARCAVWCCVYFARCAVFQDQHMPHPPWHVVGPGKMRNALTINFGRAGTRWDKIDTRTLMGKPQKDKRNKRRDANKNPQRSGRSYLEGHKLQSIITDSFLKDIL